ncbi:MAG: 2-oxoacid:acceptor oxidoreductase family protein [Deltaproteobacteria bacterium]|nr:2-oxoacid:acceptor oxidoreductase family protein [Deltaproteobacteria bacterium]
MIEIRFHGRGGQGAVVGSKVLSIALFSEGKFVQAFPAFGVERRGAPVTAFLRINDNIINLRNEIYSPDHLIVLDHTLMNNPAIFTGLKKGGWVLVNSKIKAQNAKLADNKIAVVDASHIAAKNGLGSATSPIVNTAILGAFAKITGICSIDSVCSAIKKSIPYKPEANAAAAREAYEQVNCS